MNTPFSEPPIQRGDSQGYNPQPQPGTSSTALVVVGLCTVMCLFCCCGGVFLLPLAIARLPSPMHAGGRRRRLDCPVRCSIRGLVACPAGQ